MFVCGGACYVDSYCPDPKLAPCDIAGNLSMSEDAHQQDIVSGVRCVLCILTFNTIFAMLT
jgi:hypothetical protein